MPQDRAGLTKVTSVSLTQENWEFMKKYNISPTEVMRVGLGVIKAEMGMKEYQSETNMKRLEILKEIREQAEIEDTLSKLQTIYKHLFSLFNELNLESGEENDRK